MNKKTRNKQHYILWIFSLGRSIVKGYGHIISEHMIN